ncbi:hypothetical protein AB0952_08660 [Streptomyces caniferus]|uniref:hypothetical protein n=1 Tax=Streptomyces caniferus TaxID=285557 RepID=UPI0034554CF9
MTSPVSPRPACPEPLRFWDGDRLAAVHDRRVWHRWGGRWVNYLFAEDSVPFTDAQARGRLWSPGEPDAVRFIPRAPAAGDPLPGTAVAADDIDRLVWAPARSVLPYLLLPAQARGGVHHLRAAHDFTQQLNAQQGWRATALQLPAITLPAARAAVRSLLEGGQKVNASCHRPAGRLYARQTLESGVMTFVWILSREAHAPH